VLFVACLVALDGFVLAGSKVGKSVGLMEKFRHLGL